MSDTTSRLRRRPRRLGLIGTGAVLASAALAPVAHAATSASQDGTSPYFHTVGSNVNVRACEFTDRKECKVVYTIAKKGTAVAIQCWSRGTSVNGDDIWYAASIAGHDGVVAGYWLDTGHDPNPTRGACGT